MAGVWFLVLNFWEIWLIVVFLGVVLGVVQVGRVDSATCTVLVTGPIPRR